MQLTGKIFITGDIVAKTGLHIGGSKSSMDIGGIDLNVIKTPGGEPYIPGSSLKGKLRSLLARVAGSIAITNKDAKNDPALSDDEKKMTDENVAKYICEIFGMPGDDDGRGSYVTRLFVRDADLDAGNFPYEEGDMEMRYSDIKWENTINRKTGTAQHPRQLERVPAGARFKFEMVYDVYDDQKKEEHLGHILTAMRLLEGDYIGGQGSRGYGKIEFDRDKFAVEEKTVDNYRKGEAGKVLDQYKL